MVAAKECTNMYSKGYNIIVLTERISKLDKVNSYQQ